MINLRHKNLQRAVSIFILFAALFSHIQTVYACSTMGGEAKHVCCCEQASASCSMADSCAMHENNLDTTCCEISYESISDAGMLNSNSTVDILNQLLDAPQPPPDIATQQYCCVPAAVQLSHSLMVNEPLAYLADKQTYSLTHRLRIKLNLLFMLQMNAAIH